MTSPNHLKLEKADGIARITLARPKHNVLNIDMMNELNAELKRLTDDRDLKAVLILGEGASWCAGVEVADHKPELVDDMIATFGRIFELIDRLEVPVIAGVHGACLGGGMELAIAADILVASENALFGQPEIKLGFFPPYAVVRLPELVGPARAIEICTTGKRYSGAEAKEMGLAAYCVPADQFEDTLAGLVKEIKHCSPLIIRLNKRAVKQNLGKAFPAALAGANDFFLNTLMKTGDTLEGIASFEEKRRPEWKNC